MNLTEILAPKPLDASKQAPCASPAATTPADGVKSFFTRVFAPSEVPYDVVSSCPAPPAAPSPQAAVPVSTAEQATAKAPAVSSPETTLLTCPASPPSKIVLGYAFNPRLRARLPRAHEVYLEEVLEEQITTRMLARDGEPVPFVVPDGFDAVDFYVRPIELNPDVGSKDDLDLIITAGDLKLSPNAEGGNGPLKAGDQISVVVPWRYASWVELAPSHLRLPIFARFYTLQNA